ncbi:MAG: hypothetical protein JXA66_06685 [Oligoflexia bacterium]|nr:hypothetical protein [Oligoflexia bacterium]
MKTSLVILVFSVSPLLYSMDETPDAGTIINSKSRSIYYGAAMHTVSSQPLTRMPASINKNIMVPNRRTNYYNSVWGPTRIPASLYRSSKSFLFGRDLLKNRSADFRYEFKHNLDLRELPKLDEELLKLYNFRNDRFMNLWHK